MHHTLKIKVYYEDTDAGNVVYHSNYLNFAERGRTELLNSLGYTNIGLQEELGVLFVAKSAQLDFKAPARLEDELEVRTVVSELRNAALTMKQTIYRPKDDKIVCEVDIVLVCVGLRGENIMKPTRMPQTVRSAFETYLN